MGRRAQERGQRLAEEARQLAWERSAIAAQSEEREPDARTRRPRKSSTSRGAYGQSHEVREQRRREDEREIDERAGTRKAQDCTVYLIR